MSVGPSSHRHMDIFVPFLVFVVVGGSPSRATFVAQRKQPCLFSWRSARFGGGVVFFFMGCAKATHGCYNCTLATIVGEPGLIPSWSNSSFPLLGDFQMWSNHNCQSPHLLPYAPLGFASRDCSSQHLEAATWTICFLGPANISLAQVWRFRFAAANSRRGRTFLHKGVPSVAPLQIMAYINI